MERHVLILTFVRVRVFDLCQRKVLCLHSMFNFLCRLPPCNLGTSPSFTYVILTLRFALS
ncbi:hypothetical protein B296_00006514 [Ensete ventricosum]|uniref:Uncharacterized protein n=1 Tax=Ensete ventricosum TaxID=4639 RepID=A0A427A7X5_ENSVE|nr:hypothetical protein B296_00006514 [Ensete ventricosum]